MKLEARNNHFVLLIAGRRRSLAHLALTASLFQYLKRGASPPCPINISALKTKRISVRSHDQIIKRIYIIRKIVFETQINMRGTCVSPLGFFRSRLTSV